MPQQQRVRGLAQRAGVQGGHLHALRDQLGRHVPGLLLASLGYAVATTIAKRTLGGLNPVGLATTQLGLSSVMLLPAPLIGPAPAPLTVTALAGEPVGALSVAGVLAGLGLINLPPRPKPLAGAVRPES